MRRTFLKAAALGVAMLGLGLPAMAQDAPVMVIEVAGQVTGEVRIQLRPDLAPLHVERLTALAAAGSYDGVAFHRVIEGFMAQTGDVGQARIETYDQGYPGTGGSDLPDLPAEFSATPYLRGVVGMARAQDPNSANSQFFIMFTEYPSLNGQYTVVGEVISGMEIVDAIKRGQGGGGSVTEAPDYMAHVRIE